jgi:flagellar hook-associated protein 1 FlgK
VKLSQSGAGPTGPDVVYQTMIGDLGAASAQAQQRQATQDAITDSVDQLRDSASGVSLDEEVSNMLTFQQAFQASSRVLTTLDEMLDTLINHTGQVGRA